MAEKICSLKKSGLSGETAALKGKVVVRNDASAAPTINNIATGTQYGISKYGCVLFADKSYTVTRSAGAAGFCVIHPDGTYEGSGNVSSATINDGDIVLWASNCGIKLSN